MGGLQRLYEVGIHPDIICGASAGSLIAVKLAEDPHNPQQIDNLRALWEGLQTTQDMYVRIDIDYVYMRAADVLAVGVLPARAVELTQQIISLRQQIWELEAGLAGRRGRQRISAP